MRSSKCHLSEEDFVSEYLAVLDIRISSLGELKFKIDQILSSSHQDWSKNVEKLKLIRSFIIGSTTVKRDQVVTQIQRLTNFLVALIRDSRSKVARESAITTSFIIEKFGNDVCQVGECALPAAMAQVALKTKVASTAAEVLLKIIAKNVQTKHIFASIVSYSVSKDRQQRKQCVVFLEQMIKCWNAMAKEPHIQILTETIVLLLNDADSETRTASRTTFKTFQKHHLHEAECLFNKLPAITQKMLRQTSIGTEKQQLVPPMVSVSAGSKFSAPPGVARPNIISGAKENVKAKLNAKNEGFNYRRKLEELLELVRSLEKELEKPALIYLDSAKLADEIQLTSSIYTKLIEKEEDVLLLKGMLSDELKRNWDSKLKCKINLLSSKWTKINVKLRERKKRLDQRENNFNETETDTGNVQGDTDNIVNSLQDVENSENDLLIFDADDVQDEKINSDPSNKTWTEKIVDNKDETYNLQNENELVRSDVTRERKSFEEPREVVEVSRHYDCIENRSNQSRAILENLCHVVDWKAQLKHLGLMDDDVKANRAQCVDTKELADSISALCSDEIGLLEPRLLRYHEIRDAIGGKGQNIINGTNELSEKSEETRTKDEICVDNVVSANKIRTILEMQSVRLEELISKVTQEKKFEFEPSLADKKMLRKKRTSILEHVMAGKDSYQKYQRLWRLLGAKSLHRLLNNQIHIMDELMGGDGTYKIRYFKDKQSVLYSLVSVKSDDTSGVVFKEQFLQVTKEILIVFSNSQFSETFDENLIRYINAKW